jgi:ribosomal protein S18 acetylase RimI-like enzyme
VGIGQVKPHRDGSKEVASLVVDPELRGRGIASRLMSRLIQDHPIPLWLVCRSELVEFYRRFGFQAVTDPLRMPPYFRRLARLVRLLGNLRGKPFPMAIMHLDHGQTDIR